MGNIPKSSKTKNDCKVSRKGRIGYVTEPTTPARMNFHAKERDKNLSLIIDDNKSKNANPTIGL